MTTNKNVKVGSVLLTGNASFWLLLKIKDKDKDNCLITFLNQNGEIRFIGPVSKTYLEKLVIA